MGTIARWFRHASASPALSASGITASEAAHDKPDSTQELLRNYVEGILKCLDDLERLARRHGLSGLVPTSPTALGALLEVASPVSLAYTNGEWGVCCSKLTEFLTLTALLLRTEAELVLPDATRMWPSVPLDTFGMGTCSATGVVAEGALGVNVVLGVTGALSVDFQELALLTRSIMCDATELMPRLLRDLPWMAPSARAAANDLFSLLLYLPEVTVSPDGPPELQPSAMARLLTCSAEVLQTVVNDMASPCLCASACAFVQSILRFCITSGGLQCNHKTATEVEKALLSDTAVIELLFKAMGGDSPLHARWTACTVLRTLLLSSGSTAASVMLTGFESIVSTINRGLLDGPDFTVKTPALKLLFDVLADRKFIRVMKAYVSHVGCLRTILEIFLNDPDPVKLDAFHILKLFIMNPQTPPGILTVLSCHRNTLLLSLSQMGRRIADDNFTADRRTVTQRLQQIELTPKKGTPTISR